MPEVARGEPWRARAATVARVAVHSALDLLLPRSCAACDRELAAHEEGIVCGTCWARLVPLPHPRCNRCGHPTEGRSCRFCALLPPFVRAARSVCWVPHEVASAIVYALKYHGWTAAAGAMGARMARESWPDDVARERAAVIPVPLARSRARERGFNQAERLAAVVAERWGIPVNTQAVSRDRPTDTQTRLTPGERSANVRGAFGVPDGARQWLRGRHLVLVDDVLTTGATLNACATVLFEAGARTISFLTFGRARASGDR
jgi:ComF family protein